MSFRVLIISLSILLLCCCAGPDERLVRINTLAEESPEAALDSLDSIDVDKLSEFDRHYYDLTTVKACDKAFAVHSSDSSIVAAIDYFAEHGADSIYAEALYYGGRVCDELGDKPRALSYFQEALNHLPDSDKSLNLKFRVLSQTGRLLDDFKLFENAAQYVGQAIEIERKMNDTLSEVYDLQLLGVIHLRADNFSLADSIFKLAYIRAQKLDVEHKAKTAMYLGAVKYRLGDIDSALFFIKDTPSMVNPIARNSALAYSTEIYYDAGMLDSAYSCAYRMIQSQDDTNKATAYSMLLTTELRHFLPSDSVFVNLRDYLSLLESYYDDNEENSVLMQHTMYNYKMHEAEKIKALKSNEKLRTFIWLGCVCFLVLCVVILYLKYRNERSVAELQRALEIIRQLETRVITDDLVDRTHSAIESQEKETVGDLRDKLREKLFDIYNKTKDSYEIPIELLNSEVYEELQDKIAKSLAINDDAFWIRLEAEINKISPEFKRNLQILLGGKFSTYDMHTSLLIKCGVAPTQMAILMNRTKGTMVSRRESMAFRIFGEKKNTKIADGIIRLL